MEPPGARPSARRAPGDKSLRGSTNSLGGTSVRPSRADTRGNIPSPAGSEMDGEDWDAMVKSFLQSEIERTAARQEWLKDKLAAAKELDAAASDDGRSDIYKARCGARPRGCCRGGKPVWRARACPRGVTRVLHSALQPRERATARRADDRHAPRTSVAAS